MTKDQALARIIKTRQSLLQALSHLNEAEMESLVVEGAWTVKDLLGHITAWEQACLEPLEHFAAGRSFECAEIPDHDAWNAIQAAQRQACPVADVLDELHQVRHSLLEAATRLDDARWSQPLALPWGEQATAAHMLSGLAWHEEEHQKSILSGKIS